MKRYLQYKIVIHFSYSNILYTIYYFYVLIVSNL